jgi:hypothetical protein
MGSLLATALLVVPPIAWLGGTPLLDDSELKLARITDAPCGIFPISRKSYFPATATRPVSDRTRTVVDEVSR